MKNLKLLIAAAAVVGIVSGCGSQPKTENYFELTKLTMQIADRHYTKGEYFEIVNERLHSGKYNNLIEELPIEILNIDTTSYNLPVVTFEQALGAKRAKFADKFGNIMFNYMVAMSLPAETVATLDTSAVYKIENFSINKHLTDRQEVKFNAEYIDLGVFFCNPTTTVKLYDK